MIRLLGLLMLTLFLIGKALAAVAYEIKINSTDALIQFSNEVGSGTDYSEATVFLDSDITFSPSQAQNFTPIGNDKPFAGTFDGQGYTISGLVINSSSFQLIGLFGIAKNAVIRNIVLDSTCSITSSYISSESENDPLVGGIAGRCISCDIESNVNSANIFFTGNVAINLFIGSIVGWLSTSNKDVHVKNCANYGSITVIGLAASKKGNLGGIIGHCAGTQSKSIIYIQNCLNYGDFMLSESDNAALYVGGIVGSGGFTELSNCVNMGNVISSSINENVLKGSVIGSVKNDVTVMHCYWSNNPSYNKTCGSGDTVALGSTGFSTDSFTLDDYVYVGSYVGKSLFDALNSAADSYYYHQRKYAHWLFNKNEDTASFSLNGRANACSFRKQVILLPSLSSGNTSLSYSWYSDSSYQTVYTGYEIKNNVTLYGRFKEDGKTHITFDTRGGSPVDTIAEKYPFDVRLPADTMKDSCELGWWEDDYGNRVEWMFSIPFYDVTLHAVWICTRITTAEDLVSLSKVVSSGTSYKGTTVFLDADIDFSDVLSNVLEPIGKSSSYYFQGTFDGQGHTISNLEISSSLQYAGLFGYSKDGATIRNVVLDSSCSVVSSYSVSSPVYVGGIVGYCSGCTIENTVNMASVAFTGSISNKLYIGGIAGYLYAYNNLVTVRNCANYGSVTHSGTASYAYIGGIVGYSSGSSTNKVFIQNCLNYGTINHNGATTDNLYIGGILGYTISGTNTIENCVSGGKITSSKVNGYIGSVAGHVGSSSVTIAHCYWQNSLNYSKAVGSGNQKSSNTSSVEFNVTVINELNTHHSDSGWNLWLLNDRGASLSLKINNGKGFTIVSSPVQLPSLATENDTLLLFDGWFTDINHTEFDPTEPFGNVSLYGGWRYNVMFNSFGKHAGIKEVTCGQVYGDLPAPPEVEGYTFTRWCLEKDCEHGDTGSGSIVELSYNHTLYAQWVINNYTLTFDYGNGTVVSKTLRYNDTVNYPDEPEREGYTFKGWDSDITTLPAQNVKITAKWDINSYTLTFDFGNETAANRTLDFNETINYPAVEKEGYTFTGWQPSPGEMPANDLRVVAQWTINNYTLTFDFGNDTMVKRMLRYNDVIIYPTNFTRERYTFNGWVPRPDRMPAEDTTVVAQWESNGSELIIYAIVAFILAFIIFVVVAVYFVLKKIRESNDNDSDEAESERELTLSLLNKKDNNDDDDGSNMKEYTRVLTFLGHPLDSPVSLEVVSGSLSKLYPPGYEKPDMMKALLKVNLTEEQAQAITEECTKASQCVRDDGKLFEGFTEEDAAAIAMYTYDFGSKKFENNPYRIINRSLMDRNYDGLQRTSGILYLVMTALRKLPRTIGKTLYRGVRDEISMDWDHYYEGCIITWPALSSTSPDMNTTKNFLAKGSNTGKATGTLFIIEDGWGYDIQPYSLFPEEAEILLEPERQFKVKSVIQAEGLIFISLKMLDTPLALPQVFGEGNKQEIVIDDE